MSQLQSSSLLINRIKTLKEMYIDFLATESNVYHLDMTDALEKLYR